MAPKRSNRKPEFYALRAGYDLTTQERVAGRIFDTFEKLLQYIPSGYGRFAGPEGYAHAGFPELDSADYYIKHNCTKQ